MLRRVHARIVEASRRREPLTPDAEWLLDNYYIVEDVLREVRQDLPASYYRELPLSAGAAGRLPPGLRPGAGGRGAHRRQPGRGAGQPVRPR